MYWYTISTGYENDMSFSLTVVVNLQVVEDVVVGGPAGAAGEEHLPAFEG